MKEKTDGYSDFSNDPILGGVDSEEIKENTVFRFHLSFTLNQFQLKLGCSKF
jgi:hypothetical protein